MSMNLGKTNVAFAKLLEMAGGRYDVVEQALMEASRQAGGQAPTYDAVVAAMDRRGQEPVPAAAPPRMAAAPF